MTMPCGHSLDTATWSDDCRLYRCERCNRTWGSNWCICKEMIGHALSVSIIVSLAIYVVLVWFLLAYSEVVE